jgi:hypothetical protein
MSATIVRSAQGSFEFGVTPTVVDVSCFLYAVELGSETEEIDVGTFCAPTATDLGRTTQSAVLSMLWEPALYEALAPHVGEQGTFKFVPDDTVPTEVISFDTRYGSMPWGRFEIGQRVEVELPLAVLSDFAFTPAP